MHDLDRILGKPVENAINQLNTCDLGEILEFNTDKKTVKLKMLHDEEIILDDVPFFVFGNSNNNINFKINKGDKCIVFFTKHATDKIFNGEDEFNVPNFDINNNFALIGISQTLENIKNDDFMTINANKLKISNGTHDIIDLLIKTIEEVGNMANLLSSTMAGTYPLNTQANFVQSKASLDLLVTNLKRFKA